MGFVKILSETLSILSDAVKPAPRMRHFVIAFAQILGYFVKCNFINQSQSEYCHLNQGAQPAGRNNTECEARTLRILNPSGVASVMERCKSKYFITVFFFIWFIFSLHCSQMCLKKAFTGHHSLDHNSYTVTVMIVQCFLTSS